jgi:hypothetical protein
MRLGDQVLLTSINQGLSKTRFRCAGFRLRRENHARMREDHASGQNELSECKEACAFKRSLSGGRFAE